MPTPPSPCKDALGYAIREHRGKLSQREIEPATGIPAATLSRLERGTHAPSVATARALARWLGWTVEQVLDAAEQPAPAAAPTAQEG